MFWGVKIFKIGRKFKISKVIDCLRKSKGLNLLFYKEMVLVGEIE